MVETFPALEEEVTPEAGDKYNQASIMIPRGNTFACRTVVSRRCDAEGNIIGQAHDNPILDSCIYNVEFAHVTALMTNAQCDSDRNEYILLNGPSMCTDDALTLEQQQITVNGVTPK